MNLHQKRIFVGNLPPNVKQTEIQEQFSSYGKVVSVEIKQRKEGSKQDNSSPVFAFVNIEIDDRTLNNCFREFSEYDWDGYQVKLQLAKESFLDRLKREREEANQPKEEIKAPTPEKQTFVPNVDKTLFKKTYHSSSSSESSSESEDESDKEETKKQIPFKKITPKVEEELDYVIKNNKFNFNNGKTLKIESFSDKPIHIIKPKVEKKEAKVGKALEADEKRKKSLTNMKDSYLQQKSAIKSALSSIDVKRNNKIIFDDNPSKSTENHKRKSNFSEDKPNKLNKKSKPSLFDDDDQIDDDIDFGIKKQFEGEHGQKLLKLQSRYTNDKRFTMDSRFVEETEVEEANDLPEDDEKQKQFEILEAVLGKKITNHKPKETSKEMQRPRITMTRFDPSKPEHSKYEIKESDEVKENKKKRKEKNKQDETIDEPKIEVSKDTFYQVKENLKQSLQEKESFSLLSMFGRAEEKDIVQKNEVQEINKNKYFESNNPFKYDSSDSEDEETDKKTLTETSEVNKIEAPVTLIKKETFFFQNNDERLQEAFDFLKKLGSDVKEQPFNEKRRELKKIVRDKIKNNMRNHRPFSKKLGRSKMIKVKKAKKK